MELTCRERDALLIVNYFTRVRIETKRYSKDVLGRVRTRVYPGYSLGDCSTEGFGMVRYELILAPDTLVTARPPQITRVPAYPSELTPASVLLLKLATSSCGPPPFMIEQCTKISTLGNSWATRLVGSALNSTVRYDTEYCCCCSVAYRTEFFDACVETYVKCRTLVLYGNEKAFPP